MANDLSCSVAIVIKAAVEKAWQAIMEPALVKQWLMNTDLNTDWKVGSPVRFSGEWEGKTNEDG